MSFTVYAGIEPAISCVTGRRNSRYSNTPNKQTTFQTERPILDLNVRTYPRVSFRARNSRGLRSYRCLGLLRLSQQMRARLTKVCTFCQLLPRMKLKVMGWEGVEPPMFTARVTDLQSAVFATGHTIPFDDSNLWLTHTPRLCYVSTATCRTWTHNILITGQALYH